MRLFNIFQFSGLIFPLSLLQHKIFYFRWNPDYLFFFLLYFCFWFIENIAQAKTKVAKFIAIFYFKRFLIFCGFCLFVFVLFHFLALVFRSVIHVQWIFAYNIGKTSNSILLYVDIQLKFVEKILLISLHGTIVEN